jgi:hypothetical protein
MDGRDTRCKTCCSAKSAAWRIAHPEKEAATHAAYYAANSEKVKTDSLAYYAKNAVRAMLRITRKIVECSPFTIQPTALNISRKLQWLKPRITRKIVR